MFMSIAANAEWTKPVVQGNDPKSGEQYYIMNVEAGQYLNAGVVWFSWATSAALDDKGCAFEFTDNVTDNATRWTFTNRESHNGKFVFISGTGTDADGEMHVDGGSANEWALNKLANGNYTIAPIGAEKEGFWGWKGANAQFPNAVNCYIQEGAGAIEWIFVTAEEKTAKAEAMAIYKSAVKLGEALADIKAAYPTADVSAEQAVYNNESSTKQELDDATAAVAAKKAKAIAEEAEKNASADKPMDMTGLIVNPTFDKVNDFTGWTGGFGAGGTTSTCAEMYNKNYNAYQEMKDMPKGVYKVSVDGFYRAGSTSADFSATKLGTDNNAMVYGANMVEGAEADVATSPIMHLFSGIEPGEHFDLDGTSLGGTKLEDGDNVYYAANSMKDFTNYNGTTANVEKPFYKGNTVMFPATDGTLRIGVKKEVQIDTDWTIVDNFALTYYGNGADAWTLLINDTKNNQSIAADALISASVKTAFEQAVAATSATDYESYKAAVAAIEAAKKVADENVAKWNAYKELSDKALQILNDPNYNGVPETETLNKARIAANKDIKELTLSTEELTAKLAAFQAAYDAASEATPAGTDVTDKFIVNNDFSKGWTGWEHSGTGGNVAANAGAKCAEAWNSANFDIHQDIQNAPAGVYQVKVQGFYRYLRGDNAWLAYYNEDGSKKEEPVDVIKKTPAMIYLNDATTNMANVFDYQKENGSLYTTTGDLAPYVDPLAAYWYPNDMTAAGQAFDQDAYMVDAVGLVAKKGDPLRIGVKGNSNQGGDSWAIFTRFRLVYQGFKAEIIQPELEKLLPELEEALSDGKVMGFDVYSEAMELLATAGDAMESGDGKTMFDLLAQVYPMVTKVAESKALFAQLAEKAVDIENAMGEYTETASEEAMTAAGELMGEIQDMTAEQTEATDQDAKDKMALVASVIKKLAIPNNLAEASLDNPIDMTGFIVNPSFETGNTDGWEQISGTGTQQFGAQSNDSFGKSGNYYAERWHAAGNLDMKQDVTELPSGTYVLSVDGHASNGAVLYANAEETEFAEAEPAAPALNQVAVFINEGEAITIGVKGTLTGDTWLCVDNFQLACIALGEDKVAEWKENTSVEDVQAAKAAKAVKVAKILKQGKIFIVKDGKVFSVAGAQVK